ncbi:MAG: helix-turn-helix domain-containing protein [Micropruina sp.]|uniref:helix-turn-helix domain-containing protein n=1 Tax=Micropruina sp. TaxID=2737536 RepID=UPI0039E3A17C
MAQDKTSGDDAPATNDRTLGAESLKAFAHPLRMTLYAELQRRGPATASQLARALGESSGQTSYHLRQLERHGFVEDDPEHTGGRERWWRPVGFRLTDPELMRDPATERAAGAVIGQVIAERTATLTSWLEHLEPELADGVGQLSTSTMELTTQQADELTTELLDLIQRYSDAAKRRPRADGARRYRVYLDVVPLTVDLPEDAGDR